MAKLSFLKINDQIKIYHKDDQTHYKAVVRDLKKTGLIISQPTSKYGKLTMRSGTLWECHIESEDALYYFILKVLRQEKGYPPFYLMAYPDSVRRQQRRQFYRLPCYLELEYKIIREVEEKEEDEERKHDSELIAIPEEKDVFTNIKSFKEKMDAQDTDDIRHGVTIDISGGGLQFISSKYLTGGTELLMNLHLQNVKGGLRVKGRVVRSFPVQVGAWKKYRVALSFFDIDEKTRDIIIKFIFDQSRKRVRDI
ncbi:MAG: PilZ domain-containing protein [Dethiobacteria bacterium]